MCQRASQASAVPSCPGLPPCLCHEFSQLWGAADSRPHDRALIVSHFRGWGRSGCVKAENIYRFWSWNTNRKSPLKSECSGYSKQELPWKRHNICLNWHKGCWLQGSDFFGSIFFGQTPITSWSQQPSFVLLLLLLSDGNLKKTPTTEPSSLQIPPHRRAWSFWASDKGWS